MKLSLVTQSNLTPHRINDHCIDAIYDDGSTVTFTSNSLPSVSWTFSKETPVGIGANIIEDVHGQSWTVGIKREPR